MRVNEELNNRRTNMFFKFVKTHNRISKKLYISYNTLANCAIEVTEGMVTEPEGQLVDCTVMFLTEKNGSKVSHHTLEPIDEFVARLESFLLDVVLPIKETANE